MKLNNKTMTGRILALALLILVLAVSLAGCAKTQVQKPTINTDAFFDLPEDCTLSATELDAIADLLSATYATDFDTREMLIAAYRGHDMLAEGFDESKIDPTEVKDPDIAAVIKLIQTANTRASNDTKIYFETYETMSASDVSVLVRAMQTTVSMDASKGFLDTILGWVGTFLGWLTKYLCFGSYIAGICLFAVIVELLMLPLAIKQQKSSIRQAKLRPKEMAIKKKYAGRNDQVTQQKMRTELQELYQRENVNMAAGCLPLLVQMPIILALYNIVVDPLRYVLGQASTLSTALYQFFTASPAAGGLGMTISDTRGTITLLSELSSSRLEGLKDFMYFSNGEALSETIEGLLPRIPDFNLFGINLGAIPNFKEFNILLLVPVLTFVVYFLSMRLTKKFTYQSALAQDQQTACSGWLMDIYMPGMSTFFAFMVPALVGLYWIFKSVVSTLRQFIVCRLMPYPQFTEEDYRAAEREYAGKAPRKNAPAAARSYGHEVQMVGGKPKSLFHMDDDDYLAKVEAEAAREESEDEGRTTDGGKLGEISLKADDRPARKKKSETSDESSQDAQDTENNDEQN